jgi:hypothetical protein
MVSIARALCNQLCNNEEITRQEYGCSCVVHVNDTMQDTDFEGDKPPRYDHEDGILGSSVQKIRVRGKSKLLQ